MDSEQVKLRRRRRKHLAPLERMNVGEIVDHIYNLNLTNLRLLQKAMKSCSSTNCSWISYEIAERFGGDVDARTVAKEAIRAKRTKHEN